MVYYLTRLAVWLAGRVPRPIRLALAGPLTVLIYYGWAEKRRNTNANMAQILGTSPDHPRARRLARDSWRDFGRYVSDFFWLPNATPEMVLRRTKDVAPAPGVFALLDETQAHGKGTVVVSFHFGAYDVAGVVVGTRYPTDLIVESFDDPRMDDLVMRQRRGLGLGILRIEKTPRQILRALKQNRIVAVAIDRPMDASEGVPVTFFGKTCYVPGGIAQIALLADAPVIAGYCRYDERFSDTYYLGAEPPIYPRNTGDRKADVQRLTQEMFTAMERIVREHPEQWAMFRRFWAEEATTTLQAAPDDQAGRLTDAEPAAARSTDHG